MKNNITLGGIAEMIEKAQSVLIICHKRPDGDTLGSAFAIKNAYPEKDISVVCENTPSGNLPFVCSGQTDLSLERLTDEQKNAELVMTVDCAGFDMTGRYGEMYKDRIKIQIDHHRSGDVFAENYYIDMDSAACAEIIYDMLRQSGRLNKSSALSIYCGISTDTGCYKFGNTTAKTHRITAELFDLGIDFKKANEVLFENKTPGEIASQRLALNNLEILAGGRAAVVTVTNEMKKEYGVTSDDLSVINGLPREISGVDLGIVIKENDDADGVYKISMRSSQAVDVSEICASLGGGGHIRAAGAEIRAASTAEAKAVIFKAVNSFVPDFDL